MIDERVETIDEGLGWLEVDNSLIFLKVFLCKPILGEGYMNKGDLGSKIY